MRVPLANLGHAVGFARKTAFGQLARIGAQAHGAAQFIHSFEFAQFVNHAVRRGWVAFGGVSVFESANVAGELDHGSLHAEAYPEVRNFSLTRVPDAGDHPLHAAFAESTWYKNTVELFQVR